MEALAHELGGLVWELLPGLRAISEADSHATRGPGSWSRKQILGHLIDSAANNHQRFVRAQLAPALEFPGYEQEAWVAAQGYGERPWEQLVALWAELNLHLAHVVRRLPAACLGVPCTIGGGQAVTLQFVAQDYVRHLRHHLEQILTPAATLGRQHPPFG